MGINSQGRLARNEEIIALYLEGLPQDEIASQVGLTQGRISQILNQDVHREILEQGQRDQIRLLPKANKRLASLLDSEDEKVALGAVQTVHRNTGITPAHTQSVFINNLLAVGQGSDPAFLRELGQILRAKHSLPGPSQEGEVVDVEPVSD